MGVPRTLPAVSVGANPPTPVYSGTPIASVSASITKGIATIVLASLPDNGFNGPNNAIQGNWPAPNGQQVTLYGFGATFGPLFNGKTVMVIANDPILKSFSFYYNHVDIASAADAAGKAAASPFQHYRVVRIEAGQGNGTDIVYVGDGNVSSSRYVAALTLTGQIAVEIASENIPADRIFITGTSSGDTVQVSLVY